MKHFILFFLIGSMLPGLWVYGQEYSLKDIMKGNDFIGYQPENQRWTADGTHLLYDLRTKDSKEPVTYGYNIKTESTFPITPEFELQHPVLEQTKNCTYTLFITKQTLYRYSHQKKTIKPVYSSTQRISDIQYDLDCRAYFSIAQQVFRYDDETGAIQQIVSIQKQNTEKTGNQSQLSLAEQELFQSIRELKEEIANKEREKAETQIPIIHYDSPSISQVQVSTDAAYLFFRMDYPIDEKETEVQKHITPTGYTEQTKARPKVGNTDPTHRLAIYSFLKDSLYFVDFSSLSNIRRKPAYFLEYGDSVRNYDHDRSIIMHRLISDNAGNYYVCDLRSYDNKDRWIVEVDIKSGKIKEIEHQHDEAWIGGPGISSWNMVEGTLDFIPQSTTLYYQSEVTGYSHLYFYDCRNGSRKQVTSGEWEVYQVQASADGTILYLTGNKLHPGTRCLYKFNIKKEMLIPILEGYAAYESLLSPDEKYFAIRHSSSTQPWELYTLRNDGKSGIKRISQSTSKEFDAVNWIKPEIIQLEADGEQVYARLYRPQVKSNGAAVLFAHGAGYLQNAHHYWSQYHREYLFHDYLSKKGYTILDIDYRASEGYGSKHRTAIYRHMGLNEVNDYLSGRQFLIDSLDIDSTRIGIYGGSYGGFLTLMALFQHPGKFACGAALRAVTDWQHYNHEYTSNILNYPETDPLAYRKSSPIYFAENLQDRLLILHGMVDDNVQFQDVIRLTQRLIELEKDHWDLAVYPIEAHGFKASSSWLDEYKRIEALFYETLIRK